MQTKWRRWGLLFLFVTTVLSGCLMRGQGVARDASIGMIVFEDWVENKGVIPKIVVSRADGTGRRILGPDGINPLWFPSGDRILFFVPDRSPGFMRLETGKSIVLNLEGKVEKEIPYRITDISPNGTELLTQYGTDLRESYGANKVGYEIFIYDLKTDHLRKLIGLSDIPSDIGAVSLVGAKWLPDGNRILFELLGRPDPQMKGYPRSSQFCMVRKDGTGFQQLTEMFEIDDRLLIAGPKNFDISPDGRQVVFEKDVVDKTRSYGQIFVMHIDGSNVRQLTNGRTSKGSPVWSPDGTKIMYSDFKSIGDDTSREAPLMTMNADGSSQRRVFPKTWRHYLGFIPFLLFEWDDQPDWWAPRS